MIDDNDFRPAPNVARKVQNCSLVLTIFKKNIILRNSNKFNKIIIIIKKNP